MIIDDRDYSLAIGAASLFLADDIAGRTGDESRAEKMRRVVAKKQEQLQQILPSHMVSFDAATIVAAQTAGWDRPSLYKLFIDLTFADPFAPYSLEHKDRHRAEALRRLAEMTGQDAGLIEQIETCRDDAVGAHHHRNLAKVVLFGVGGMVAVGGLGFLAAPALATMLGSAAGLTGAAATAHGLALLGGGSLAAGGMGMAGGMWVVTGVGAAAGITGGSASTILYQLGAAEARAELVKFQVTFRLVVLGAEADMAKAQKAIGDLATREEELRAAIQEERNLNDNNSQRVKDLEEKLRAVVDSLRWIRDEGHKAGDDDAAAAA